MKIVKEQLTQKIKFENMQDVSAYRILMDAEGWENTDTTIATDFNRDDYNVIMDFER